MGAKSHYLSGKFFLAAVVILCMAGYGYAQSNILMIFDASGSMKARIDTVSKMDIAKSVVGDYIGTIPDQVNVGLIAYGHRQKGDCNDVEYIVQAGQSNRDQLVSTVMGLKPIGKTPLTKSLGQAVDILDKMAGDNYIILVSDGRESCHDDPCELIKKVKAQGKKVVVHVIGFSVRPRAAKELKCIAASGNGTYFPVDDSDGLKIAFQTVKQQIPYIAETPPPPLTPPTPPALTVDEGDIPFQKGFLSTDKQSYVAGSKARVTFRVQRDYPKNAWVGIIPSDIPHGDEMLNDQHDITYQYLKGQKEGTLSFHVPGEPGSYDFRLHDTDSNGHEIASVTFAVHKGNAALTLSKNEFTSGEPFEVLFSTKVKLADNAWVGIVPSDIPHGDEAVNDRHDLGYKYLKGEISGTKRFNAPAKSGSYDLRLHDTDNKGTEIASITFRVNSANASVSTDKSEYMSGETIRIRFKTENKLAKRAWLGIIPSDIPHGSESRNDSHDIAYKYLNGEQEGLRELNAPAKPGQYDIRLHDTNNNGNELCHTTFTVVKPSAFLKLKKTEFYGGETIWVNFETPSGLNKRAWAGVIPSDVPHGSESRNDDYDLEYHYLDGKQTGWLEFVAPTKPGRYDIRLHDTNNDGNEIASATFKTQKATATLSLNKKAYSPGEVMWISYSTSVKFSKRAKAWIGILPADIPHGEEDRNDGYDISYTYFKDKDGTLKLNAPDKPGNYDVRLHDANRKGNELIYVPFRVK